MEEVTVTSKKRGRSKTLQGSGRVAEKEIIVVDNNSVVVDDVVQYKAGMTPEDKEYIVKCMQEIKNGLTPDPPKSEFFMPAALIILVAIIVLVSVVGIPSGKTGIPFGKNGYLLRKNSEYFICMDYFHTNSCYGILFCTIVGIVDSTHMYDTGVHNTTNILKNLIKMIKLSLYYMDLIALACMIPVFVISQTY